MIPRNARTRINCENGASAVVPVAVTDSYRGYPLADTTAAIATHDGKLGPIEGRVFERGGKALIGAAVELPVGARFRPPHGSTAENVLATHDHDREAAIVGRLAAAGTPWDRAIIVPVEMVWSMHARVAPALLPAEAHRRSGAATLPEWSS